MRSVGRRLLHQRGSHKAPEGCAGLQIQRARHSNMKAQTSFKILLLFATALSAGAQNTTRPAPAGNAAAGAAFFRVGFPNVHGNGRSCATCHVPEEAFQLTPENVEARFQSLQQRRLTNPGADDPLFRTLDANDGADDFTNLRKHALVRVFIQLPLDAQGQRLCGRSMIRRRPSWRCGVRHPA
jgi:hypothetical protein